jgi:hypothetical protein
VALAPSAPYYAPPPSSLLQGPPSYDSLPPALPPPSSFPLAPLVFAPVFKPAPLQIEGQTDGGGGTGTGGTVVALSSFAPSFCSDCGARIEVQGKKFCAECGAQLRM